jgi:acetyl esterase
MIYKTIGEIELRMDLFNPPDHQHSDQTPCILFFHGGGWNGGTPSQFHPHCQYLASRGMVALSAEYRLKDRHGTTPFECVKDGKSAVRWIRKNAAELGIDPGRIAVGGGSAGGHVAAATATVTDFEEQGEDTAISPRPDALVLFNPVYDNSAQGFGHDRLGNRWQAFSPMHNIAAGAPPTVVFFGTEDQWAHSAAEYKKRMEDVGSRCDLHLYEGQPHGFFNYRDGASEHYYLTLIETDKFLASLRYIEGSPTLQPKPSSSD